MDGCLDFNDLMRAAEEAETYGVKGPPARIFHDSLEDMYCDDFSCSSGDERDGGLGGFAEAGEGLREAPGQKGDRTGGRSPGEQVRDRSQDDAEMVREIIRVALSSKKGKEEMIIETEMEEEEEEEEGDDDGDAAAEGAVDGCHSGGSSSTAGRPVSAAILSGLSGAAFADEGSSDCEYEGLQPGPEPNPESAATAARGRFGARGESRSREEIREAGERYVRVLCEFVPADPSADVSAVSSMPGSYVSMWGQEDSDDERDPHPIKLAASFRDFLLTLPDAKRVQSYWDAVAAECVRRELEAEVRKAPDGSWLPEPPVPPGYEVVPHGFDTPDGGDEGGGCAAGDPSDWRTYKGCLRARCSLVTAFPPVETGRDSNDPHADPRCYAAVSSASVFPVFRPTPMPAGMRAVAEATVRPKAKLPGWAFRLAANASFAGLKATPAAAFVLPRALYRTTDRLRCVRRAQCACLLLTRDFTASLDAGSDERCWPPACPPPGSDFLPLDEDFKLYPGEEAGGARRRGDATAPRPCCKYFSRPWRPPARGDIRLKPGVDPSIATPDDGLEWRDYAGLFARELFFGVRKGFVCAPENYCGAAGVSPAPAFRFQYPEPSCKMPAVLAATVAESEAIIKAQRRGGGHGGGRRTPKRPHCPSKAFWVDQLSAAMNELGLPAAAAAVEKRIRALYPVICQWRRAVEMTARKRFEAASGMRLLSLADDVPDAASRTQSEDEGSQSMFPPLPAPDWGKRSDSAASTPAPSARGGSAAEALRTTECSVTLTDCRKRQGRARPDAEGTRTAGPRSSRPAERADCSASGRGRGNSNGKQLRASPGAPRQPHKPVRDYVASSSRGDRGRGRVRGSRSGASSASLGSSCSSSRSSSPDSSSSSSSSSSSDASSGSSSSRSSSSSSSSASSRSSSPPSPAANRRNRRGGGAVQAHGKRIPKTRSGNRGGRAAAAAASAFASSAQTAASSRPARGQKVPKLVLTALKDALAPAAAKSVGGGRKNRMADSANPEEAAEPRTSAEPMAISAAGSPGGRRPPSDDGADQREPEDAIDPPAAPGRSDARTEGDERQGDDEAADADGGDSDDRQGRKKTRGPSDKSSAPCCSSSPAASTSSDHNAGTKRRRKGTSSSSSADTVDRCCAPAPSADPAEGKSRKLGKKRAGGTSGAAADSGHRKKCAADVAVAPPQVPFGDREADAAARGLVAAPFSSSSSSRFPLADSSSADCPDSLSVPARASDRGPWPGSEPPPPNRVRYGGTGFHREALPDEPEIRYGIERYGRPGALPVPVFVAEMGSSDAQYDALVKFIYCASKDPMSWMQNGKLGKEDQALEDFVQRRFQNCRGGSGSYITGNVSRSVPHVGDAMASGNILWGMVHVVATVAMSRRYDRIQKGFLLHSLRRAYAPMAFSERAAVACGAVHDDVIDAARAIAAGLDYISECVSSGRAAAADFSCPRRVPRYPASVSSPAAAAALDAATTEDLVDACVLGCDSLISVAMEGPDGPGKVAEVLATAVDSERADLRRLGIACRCPPSMLHKFRPVMAEWVLELRRARDCMTAARLCGEYRSAGAAEGRAAAARAAASVACVLSPYLGGDISRASSRPSSWDLTTALFAACDSPSFPSQADRRAGEIGEDEPDDRTAASAAKTVGAKSLFKKTAGAFGQGAGSDVPCAWPPRSADDRPSGKGKGKSSAKRPQPRHEPGGAHASVTVRLTDVVKYPGAAHRESEKTNRKRKSTEEPTRYGGGRSPSASAIPLPEEAEDDDDEGENEDADEMDATAAAPSSSSSFRAAAPADSDSEAVIVGDSVDCCLPPRPIALGLPGPPPPKRKPGGPESRARPRAFPGPGIIPPGGPHPGGCYRRRPCGYSHTECKDELALRAYFDPETTAAIIDDPAFPKKWRPALMFDPAAVNAVGEGREDYRDRAAWMTQIADPEDVKVVVMYKPVHGELLHWPDSWTRGPDSGRPRPEWSDSRGSLSSVLAAMSNRVLTPDSAAWAGNWTAPPDVSALNSGGVLLLSIDDLGFAGAVEYLCGRSAAARRPLLILDAVDPSDWPESGPSVSGVHVYVKANSSPSCYCAVRWPRCPELRRAVICSPGIFGPGAFDRADAAISAACHRGGGCPLPMLCCSANVSYTVKTRVSEHTKVPMSPRDYRDMVLPRFDACKDMAAQAAGLGLEEPDFCNDAAHGHRAANRWGLGAPLRPLYLAVGRKTRLDTADELPSMVRAFCRGAIMEPDGRAGPVVLDCRAPPSHLSDAIVTLSADTLSWPLGDGPCHTSLRYGRGSGADVETIFPMPIASRSSAFVAARSSVSSSARSAYSSSYSVGRWRWGGPSESYDSSTEAPDADYYGRFDDGGGGGFGGRRAGPCSSSSAYGRPRGRRDHRQRGPLYERRERSAHRGRSTSPCPPDYELRGRDPYDDHPVAGWGRQRIPRGGRADEPLDDRSRRHNNHHRHHQPHRASHRSRGSPEDYSAYSSDEDEDDVLVDDGVRGELGPRVSSRYRPEPFSRRREGPPSSSRTASPDRSSGRERTASRDSLGSDSDGGDRPRGGYRDSAGHRGSRRESRWSTERRVRTGAGGDGPSAYGRQSPRSSGAGSQDPPAGPSSGAAPAPCSSSSSTAPLPGGQHPADLGSDDSASLRAPPTAGGARTPPDSDDHRRSVRDRDYGGDIPCGPGRFWPPSVGVFGGRRRRDVPVCSVTPAWDDTSSSSPVTITAVQPATARHRVGNPGISSEDPNHLQRVPSRPPSVSSAISVTDGADRRADADDVVVVDDDVVPPTGADDVVNVSDMDSGDDVERYYYSSHDEDEDMFD